MAKTLTSKVCGGSFVKAVYALYKKCGLSTMGCKTDALDKLFAMANGYKGKASTFQTEFLVAVMVSSWASTATICPPETRAST